MRTLYIRNVPDEVAERLERLADQEGRSLNAFVVSVIADASRRADNRAILAGLPSIEGGSIEETVALIREMRGYRD